MKSTRVLAKATPQITETQVKSLWPSGPRDLTLRGYAAAGLCLVGILINPVKASAQVAENIACAAATAAAITAKWAAEQAFAARDARAIIKSAFLRGGPGAAEADANAAAAEAALTTAFAAANTAREAANSACSAAYAAIASSHVEYRGAVGMSYCSPITTLGGPPLAPGENPIGDGRFFSYHYGYPLIDFARGISRSQQPVHVVVHNCRDSEPVTTLTVTPPPTDTEGTCPSDSFWSGSSLVGCQPCSANLAGFRGCGFPPAQISSAIPHQPHVNPVGPVGPAVLPPSSTGLRAPTPAVVLLPASNSHQPTSSNNPHVTSAAASTHINKSPRVGSRTKNLHKPVANKNRSAQHVAQKQRAVFSKQNFRSRSRRI